MEWVVVVTTVNERSSGLLRSTLNSIEIAGFTSFNLFVDGAIPYEEYASLSTRGCINVRSPRVRTFANWYLAALQVLNQNTTADRFIFFQDDVVCSKNLRLYLESVELPKCGYLNCYTYPENESSIPGVWAPSPHQSGRGALCLVFSREVLQQIVTHERLLHRLFDDEGWKNLDGAIVSTANLIGVKEYVHTPSLVDHTGHDCSTMGHKIKARASTFRGEDFDCLTITKKPTHVPLVMPSSKKRIGVVGPCSLNGPGWINHQLVRYLEVDTWLVGPEMDHRMNYSELEELTDPIFCPSGKVSNIEKFLSRVDVVLFASDGAPPYSQLLPLALKMKKRVVCLPTFYEFRSWCADVDLFIVPESASPGDVQGGVAVPTFTIPWPMSQKEWGWLAEEYYRAIRDSERYFTAIPGRALPASYYPSGAAPSPTGTDGGDRAT